MAKIYINITRQKIEVNTDPKDIDPRVINSAFALLGQNLLKFVGGEATLDEEYIWDSHVPSDENFEIIATIKGLGPFIDNN
jgi:hypothetical protein